MLALFYYKARKQSRNFKRNSTFINLDDTKIFYNLVDIKIDMLDFILPYITHGLHQNAFIVYFDLKLPY